MTSEGNKGIVVSRSKEAKALGIKMGAPYFQFKNSYPDLICFPTRHNRYDEISKQVMSIIKTFSPDVEEVSIDEAYIDFAPAGSSLSSLLDAYPRLIVLNTFSKAWASAGIRLGMALAHPEVIALFNKVKYPYNVNILTQRAAMERLDHMDEIRAWVDEALSERTRMMQAVAALPICKQVYPSDANFFLARVTDACRIYDALVEQGIIVRNRHRIMMCENCLRITIGTPAENDELLAALKQF